MAEVTSTGPHLSADDGQRLRHRAPAAAHGVSAPCHQQAAHRRNLAAIGTLGFRGGLAAISAVSRVDILTRQTAQTGASLHLEGACQPGGGDRVPGGHHHLRADLFYNTPARMKFMKKDSAEGAAVAGIVQHLPLSHPEVSFKLLRDGAEVLHTPGDGQLLSAVYAAIAGTSP